MKGSPCSIQNNIVILQYYKEDQKIMGATKAEYFSNKQNQMSVIFKALGHPARLAILEHLLKVNSCICNDIVMKLPLSQPTISQHLRELKNAGLIKGSIDGNSICYCINEKTLGTIGSMISHYSEVIKNELNCC